jgi:PAS domain S-box-containing protein
MRDESIAGIDPLKFIVPDDRAAVKQKFIDTLHSGVQESIETRLLVHGGPNFLWVLITGRKVVIGDRPCILVIGQDINDRKKLEVELRQNQNRWDAILERWKIGLWVLRLQDNAIYRTLEHDRIFGYESLLPGWTIQTFFDHVAEDERSNVEMFHRDALSKRSDWNFECRIRRVDGQVRWIRAAGSFMFDETGKATHIQGIIEDITEQKQSETARENLQAQLQQSQKMEMLGQLAGGIAHDFNNVLAAILGHTELLLDRFDENHPAFRSIECIQKSAKRSADLVRQLLGFARKQMWYPRVIELNEELGSLRPMLSRLINENIQFRWNLENRHSCVRIDPSQLVQIVTNLCINSRDAITDTGTITIETRTVEISKADCEAGHPCLVPGVYVRLTLTDTGSGIDKHVLPHIYEPFFTTKDVGKGSGLGLSTVYGIVRQNSGYIDCESACGAGSVFSIYLPKHAGTADIAVHSGVDQPPDPGKKTILVVEDEPDILEIIRKVLMEKGCTVLTAHDAEEAVAKAETYGDRISLLITDVVLPKMNGITLGRKLLKDNPEMKVMYMSGYSAGSIGHYGLFDEGVNFMSKPFAIRDFLRIVAGVLDLAPS